MRWERPLGLSQREPARPPPLTTRESRGSSSRKPIPIVPSTTAPAAACQSECAHPVAASYSSGSILHPQAARRGLWCPLAGSGILPVLYDAESEMRPLPEHGLPHACGGWAKMERPEVRGLLRGVRTRDNARSAGDSKAARSAADVFGFRPKTGEDLKHFPTGAHCNFLLRREKGRGGFTHYGLNCILRSDSHPLTVSVQLTAPWWRAIKNKPQPIASGNYKLRYPGNCVTLGAGESPASANHVCTSQGNITNRGPGWSSKYIRLPLPTDTIPQRVPTH